MAKQGKRIPDPIRKFIIQTKVNAPRLPARLIADRVVEQFGEGAGVNKSTVSRILSSVDWSRQSSQVVEESQAMERHRELIMKPILELRGIGPLALRNYDLAVWWSRPKDPCWPVAKGQACRNDDGSMKVELDAANSRETSYLRQHLTGDPVWAALESCSDGLADDLTARLILLEEVVKRIQMSVEDGGTGLKVLADMGYGGSIEPAVSLRYAFDIFDQVLSQSLGLRLASHSRAAFRAESPGITHLAGNPVVSSPNSNDHEIAIELALKAQTEWLTIPQAREAAKAYRIAEDRANELSGHIDSLRLMMRLPPGTSCPGCDG